MVERRAAIALSATFLGCLAGICGGVVAVTAQTARAQGPTVTILQPQASKEPSKGKWVGAEGEAIAAGVHYSVRDLDLMQPVGVALFARDSARPVKLEIVKGEWSRALRTCDTGGAGWCEVRFRTQGNFGIRVSPKAAATAGYTIAVWAGDEVQTVPDNVIAARRPK